MPYNHASSSGCDQKFNRVQCEREVGRRKAKRVRESKKFEKSEGKSEAQRACIRHHWIHIRAIGVEAALDWQVARIQPIASRQNADEARVNHAVLAACPCGHTHTRVRLQRCRLIHPIARPACFFFSSIPPTSSVGDASEFRSKQPSMSARTSAVLFRPPKPEASHTFSRGRWRYLGQECISNR